MALLKELISKLKGESVTIGIDVGHYSVKAVAVAHLEKSCEILDFGMEKLEIGTLNDGAIHNRENLSNVVIDVINSLETRGKETNIVIAFPWSNGVLADKIMVKAQKGIGLEERIIFEAGHHSPFDDPDITMDYQILKSNVETQDSEVLLVASKNEVLRKWSEFFVDIGVQPVALDIDAFSMFNTFNLLNHTELPNSVGILNIGEHRSVITFIYKNAYHSTRDIKRGSIDSVVKAISRKVGYNIEEVRRMMESESVMEEHTDLVMDFHYSYDNLIAEVSHSFQYFQSYTNEQVDQVFLCGGGGNIPGLKDHMKEVLGIEVEYMPGLDNLRNVSMGEGVAIADKEARVLNIALGMALRKF